MPRWTVSVGDDVFVVERTGGTWVLDIPSKTPLVADREQVEELRLKLGAALADDGDAQ